MKQACRIRTTRARTHGSVKARTRYESDRRVLTFGGTQPDRPSRGDVETGFQKCLGWFEMRVVWRDDGSEVDAAIRRSAPRRPPSPETIHSGGWGRDTPRACGLRVVPVAREHAGHEFDVAVQHGGQSMHATDEGSETAADHSHAKSSCACRPRGRRVGHVAAQHTAKRPSRIDKKANDQDEQASSKAEKCSISPLKI